VPVRVSRPSDVDAIVATLTSAFFDDPVWGPTFPTVTTRAAQVSALWRHSVVSAQRFPWTLVTDGVESVAVWIPPGENEMTGDEEAGLDEFLVGIAGRQIADTILAMFELFEQARPTEPHFYLSLLATHREHRGAGLGMALLRENLARIDALGVPTYLESSNPANIARYESVGFTWQSELTMPAGQSVTTMWRPVR
jgi:GNAT superfamily N-acetyltransferase